MNNSKKETISTGKNNTMKKVFPIFKGLTFFFFILSFFWVVLGVYRGFSIVAAFTLGLLLFMSLGKNKETTSDIFTSCLMVADCSFIVCVMFLVGRAFMGM